MLLPAEENPLPSQTLEDENPGPITGDDGEEEYQIDEVLRCRTRKGERQALVKWTGMAQPEWTSLINLQDAVALENWEKNGAQQRQTMGQRQGKIRGEGKWGGYVTVWPLSKLMWIPKRIVEDSCCKTVRK